MAARSTSMTGASSGWLERMARFGLAVKGIVYAIVGILAIQVALGTGGQVEGTQGAIRAIARQPFGTILIGLTALGLVGYAIWRLLQAIKDPDREGTDARGIVTRIGYAISGLIYLGLALLAARILLGSGGGGGGGGEQDATARLLEQPFGQWLVAIVGFIIIGVGVYHFFRAYEASFMEKYDRSAMSRTEQEWAKRIGRFGFASRGVVFCLIGAFLIQAGLQSDPGEARGLDGALQALRDQPYGPWLLGIVAAGFVAYAIYCFSAARYRRIRTA